MTPDPAGHCGPYKPLPLSSSRPQQQCTSAGQPAAPRAAPPSHWPTTKQHDTVSARMFCSETALGSGLSCVWMQISMIAIDAEGHMAAGSSSNGAIHKVCTAAVHTAQSCRLQADAWQTK